MSWMLRCDGFALNDRTSNRWLRSLRLAAPPAHGSQASGLKLRRSVPAVRKADRISNQTRELPKRCAWPTAILSKRQTHAGCSQIVNN